MNQPFLFKTLGVAACMTFASCNAAYAQDKSPVNAEVSSESSVDASNAEVDPSIQRMNAIPRALKNTGPSPMPVYNMDYIGKSPKERALKILRRRYENAYAGNLASKGQSGTDPKSLSDSQNPSLNSEHPGINDPIVTDANDLAANNIWIAERGSTLRDVLETWADEAGWQISWLSENSYPLEASATLPGDFIDAALGILEPFSRATPPVYADFYPNRVIVISTPTADHQ